MCVSSMPRRADGHGGARSYPTVCDRADLGQRPCPEAASTIYVASNCVVLGCALDDKATHTHTKPGPHFSAQRRVPRRRNAIGTRLGPGGPLHWALRVVAGGVGRPSLPGRACGQVSPQAKKKDKERETEREGAQKETAVPISRKASIAARGSATVRHQRSLRCCCRDR